MNRLMKLLTFSTIALYAHINSPVSYAMENEEYDPTRRPAVVQDIIDEEFASISACSSSEWVCNGKEQYHIFDINEHLLVKAIILDSPDQTIFNVLDMGGGNFQWGHVLSKFLENDEELASRDFQVNIINTRGEQYTGEKVENTAKCTLYNLGAFKLENLKESLNKEGLFTGQETFDFIIASWCLRHLTDSMGTMIQAYNLLGSKRLMLFDGFSFSLAFPGKGHPVEGVERDQGDCFMVKFLMDMEIPFLMSRYRNMRSYNQFMLRKLDKNIQRLPYGFDGIHDFGKQGSGIARYYLKFKVIKHKNNMLEITDQYEVFAKAADRYNGNTFGNLLFGDKSMFDFISDFYIYKPFSSIKLFEGQ